MLNMCKNIPKYEKRSKAMKIEALTPLRECTHVAKFHFLLMKGLEVAIEIC